METSYKYVKELPEPVTAMCVYCDYIIVATGNKVYKAKLPDGDILYQCSFAMFDNKDGDI